MTDLNKYVFKKGKWVKDSIPDSDLSFTESHGVAYINSARSETKGEDGSLHLTGDDSDIVLYPNGKVGVVCQFDAPSNEVSS